MKRRRVRWKGGRLFFRCPACGEQHRAIIHPTAWSWNYDLIAPTIEPSVRVEWTAGEDEICCHTTITNGRIYYWPDSTHEMAGQTVEMVPWRQ